MRQSHRSGRLAHEIRIQLAQIVNRMADPRVGLASVTEVRLSPDLRHAHVLVSVLGREEEQQRSLMALEAARHYLRHQLAGELQLRFTPDLTFELDRSFEATSRVDELLHRAKKQGEK